MSRRKILLADDSITIQKVVNLTFADEGIEVVTVGDGDAALEQLSAEVPDILLADVNMPGPNGYEICERLRQAEATQNLPVILLVGSFEPFDEAEASRVGANAYLTKPFQSIRMLIEQVNELIEAAKTSEVTASDEPAEDASSPDAEETLPLPAVDEVFIEEPSTISVESEAPEAGSQEREQRYFDDLGYPSPVPQDEPPASAPAVTASDDLEDLYEKSLAGGEQTSLSDIGIDDEIIETSYAADGHRDHHDNVEDSSRTHDGEPAYGDSSTDVSSSMPEEQPAGGGADEFGTVSGFHQASPEDPSRLENTLAYENWQPPTLDGDNDVRSQSSGGNVSENTNSPANFDRNSPGLSEPASGAIGEETIQMEHRFDTTSSGHYQFEDVDLLDLSQSQEQPVELTSPVNALEKGSNQQVVTLSPELIEMIAQRVVEKLSEKY